MAETFQGKLLQMQRDLASIVDRMNRDRSFEVATAAQTALVAVDAVGHAVENVFGDDVEWAWQPEEEKARG